MGLALIMLNLTDGRVNPNPAKLLRDKGWCRSIVSKVAYEGINKRGGRASKVCRPFLVDAGSRA